MLGRSSTPLGMTPIIMPKRDYCHREPVERCQSSARPRHARPFLDSARNDTHNYAKNETSNLQPVWRKAKQRAPTCSRKTGRIICSPFGARQGDERRSIPDAFSVGVRRSNPTCTTGTRGFEQRSPGEKRAGRRLAVAAGYVIFSPLILRFEENVSGVAALNKFAHEEKGGVVGDT